LRFRLSAPALVQVSVQTPTGEVAATTPPQLVEAGESTVSLPSSTQPGHVVSLTAYSGLHRVASTPVDTAALAPAGAAAAEARRLAASRSASQGSPPVVPAAIAFMLLLGVTVSLVVDRLAPAHYRSAQADEG
jgi:hypothetical protein